LFRQIIHIKTSLIDEMKEEKIKQKYEHFNTRGKTISMYENKIKIKIFALL